MKLLEGLVALALPLTLYLKDLGRRLARGRQILLLRFTQEMNRLRSF